MKLAKPSVSKMIAMGVATAACTMALAGPAFADEATGLVDVGETSSGIVARDTIDRGFTFHLDTQTTDATGYYPKEDTSRTYVRADRVDHPCQLFVDATGGINATVGGRAYLNYPGEWHIRQNVYEWGHRSARLTGWRSGLGTIAKGVWSADSWGRYEPIN